VKVKRGRVTVLRAETVVLSRTAFSVADGTRQLARLRFSARGVVAVAHARTDPLRLVLVATYSAETTRRTLVVS
jgi:hypothetical protein